MEDLLAGNVANSWITLGINLKNNNKNKQLFYLKTYQARLDHVHDRM